LDWQYRSVQEVRGWECRSVEPKGRIGIAWHVQDWRASERLERKLRCGNGPDWFGRNVGYRIGRARMGSVVTG
jgi:hypothetical protein